MTELLARRHDVIVYEPQDAWSLRNLVAEHGLGPLAWFHEAFPGLSSNRYELSSLDLDAALDGADLVLVHEWNEPQLVARIGQYRARNPRCRLLFHDTHHRAATAPDQIRRYGLREYDGVLAFGRVIRDLYLTLTLCFTPPSRGRREHYTSPPLVPEEFAEFASDVIGRYASARPQAACAALP